MRAIGEAAARDRIFYGIPDVLGAERSRYAGRRVLVVGSGHSALNALLELAQLAAEEPATRITWAIRRTTIGHLLGGPRQDQLEERGKLGSSVRGLLDSRRVELATNFHITEVSLTPEGLIVSDGERRLPLVDEIVAATGFRPDWSILSEVRLDLDPAVESPRALAPLIDPNVHSCGTVPPHGAEELKQPDSNLFVVGMKSYGRAPTFLMRTGYEQVRSVVSAIAGDWEAARRVELVLPETGVCSTDRSGSAASSCCGSAPDSEVDIPLVSVSKSRPPAAAQTPPLELLLAAMVSGPPMTTRAILAIGVGQLVNWGVLYYAFGVLMLPLERDLGVARWVVAGAFSLALLDVRRRRPSGRPAERSGARTAPDSDWRFRRCRPPDRVGHRAERGDDVPRVGRAGTLHGRDALRARVCGRRPRAAARRRSSQGPGHGHGARRTCEHRVPAAHGVHERDLGLAHRGWSAGGDRRRVDVAHLHGCTAARLAGVGRGGGAVARRVGFDRTRVPARARGVLGDQPRERGVHDHARAGICRPCVYTDDRRHARWHSRTDATPGQGAC